MRVQPRYPGTEARAGKFPGPSLIPALTAIQRRCGWLPREEHSRLYRRTLAGALQPDAIIATLKESELRGMGGAGFPTGQKWEIVAQQEPTPHYTICNADESEPGTFKDRQILAEQPHLVLEGMLLGMLVSGSEEGWIFIRHEYGPE